MFTITITIMISEPAELDKLPRYAPLSPLAYWPSHASPTLGEACGVCLSRVVRAVITAAGEVLVPKQASPARCNASKPRKYSAIFHARVG
jgi:hypothetical protein